MRIHVAPLAENVPGAPGLPKDVLGPAAAAALTGGSVRPRPRAPLKSRPATDDDPKGISPEAAAVAGSTETVDPDLIPPSFREHAPVSSRASSAGEGAPKKKKKKKRPAADAPDSSIAPTSSTLEPKLPAVPTATKTTVAPTSRMPLYVVAAAVLLGGGYMVGKLGNDTAPSTAEPQRSAAATLVAPSGVPTQAETARAPTPSPTLPAAPSNDGAVEASNPTPSGAELPAPTAPVAGTAASTNPPSTAGSPVASPSPVTSPSPSSTVPPATAAAAADTATTPAETATAATAAPPSAEVAFDKGAASAALAAAAGQAGGCKQEGDPSGTARVQVTFVPSGRVTSANVQGPPFAGTPTGGCIARAFRSASVPPFTGDPVTVSKTVSIP
jgi:hypothetical protein